MLVLRLAWRNVWRNSRRTGVVVTAVAVGIAGTLLSVAINYGMIAQMIETAIATELGHVQIHAAGFDRNPELDLRLADGARASAIALGELDGVRAYSRRVVAEGLLSSPRASAGVRVVGIEPEREERVSLIARSITEGRYLDGERRRVLVGEDLARRLRVGVGDKLVLSVQALSGDLTGEALRVAGLFRTPSSELDRSTVYVPIAFSQSLYGLGDGVSEVVVVAASRARVPALRDALQARLPDLEVRTWEELRPVLVYFVEVFDQSAVWIYLAVFVAMAFGIANVLLMSVYERTREIGIVTAIGMGRGTLVASIAAEALFVTFLGLAIGFALSLGSVYALRGGIDLSRWSEGLAALGVGTHIVPILLARDFAFPTAVALVTALGASAWPAVRAARLRPAEAVRRA